MTAVCSLHGGDYHVNTPFHFEDFAERRIVMLESKYQSHVIAKLRDLFPGCMILKNDSSYIQGIPDITILFRRQWAVLEIKPYANARRQPNQDWYISQMNQMSFAAFLCPENEEEVLDALQHALRPRRATRVS